LNQIDDQFEVVTVDNKSNDGTEEILNRCQKEGKLKLIQEKCNRGIGRQISFERSSGLHIIAHMDMDDIFENKIKKLIDIYQEKCSNYLVLVLGTLRKGVEGMQNITLGSRSLIEDLGGWRDLQWGEDWELWARAAKKGKFRYILFNLQTEVGSHPERVNFLSKVKYRCLRYRDLLRVGRMVFAENERKTLLQYLIFLFAKVIVPFYKKYNDPFYRNFNPYNDIYKIEI
jgi:glycosyltransferase involved in cell wall biosynthesis